MNGLKMALFTGLVALAGSACMGDEPSNAERFGTAARPLVSSTQKAITSIYAEGDVMTPFDSVLEGTSEASLPVGEPAIPVGGPRRPSHPSRGTPTA